MALSSIRSAAWRTGHGLSECAIRHVADWAAELPPARRNQTLKFGLDLVYALQGNGRTGQANGPIYSLQQYPVRSLARGTRAIRMRDSACCRLGRRIFPG